MNNALLDALAVPDTATTTQRICVTPTRNEAWIIGHFAAAARCWADHVVIADQRSTDGTR